MSILRSFFDRSPPGHSNEVVEENLYRVEKDQPVHRYPPFDKGFPADNPSFIVQSQAVLIDKIKVAAGVSPADFEKYFMQVIRNYANYVHLLPATSDEHHRGAGGLFRLGLEVAFYSLQSSSGVIFATKDSSDKRRSLQPKWASRRSLPACAANCIVPSRH